MSNLAAIYTLKAPPQSELKQPETDSKMIRKRGPESLLRQFLVPLGSVCSVTLEFFLGCLSFSE